jgi:hypothetical protein
MKNQQNNYYISRKQRLLKGFDKTASLVRGTVISHYGEELADILLKETREEFEALIPKIPYTAISPTLRTFLVISTQELAVYKVMKKHDRSADEAWEMCHEALRLRMKKFSKLKRWLAKGLLFSKFIQWLAKKRIRKATEAPPRDFAFKYVEGDGKRFDWGVDYTQCAIYNFMKDQGAEEFAPYVCLSDIALSDAMQWGLIRTETLADGCKRCDFRFKQGGKTKISSAIPKVQATIEGIRKKETDTKS